MEPPATRRLSSIFNGFVIFYFTTKVCSLLFDNIQFNVRLHGEKFLSTFNNTRKIYCRQYKEN